MHQLLHQSDSDLLSECHPHLGQLSRRTLLGAGAAATLLAAGPWACRAAAAPGYTRAPLGAPVTGLGAFRQRKMPELDPVKNRAQVPNGGVMHSPDDQPYGMSAPDGFALWRDAASGELVVHPTYATSYAGYWLSNYYVSADTTWRDKAISAVLALHEHSTVLATKRGKARFINYEYATVQDDHRLANPWFSAFGNSRMLNLCTQLYYSTKESRWLAMAKEYLNAYFVPFNPENPTDPWFMGVDREGYLWFAITPWADGTWATEFNGVPSGWFGVQTYNLLVGDDPEAKALTRGLNALMYELVDDIRIPGACSKYYVGRETQVAGYHRSNIGSLISMWNATGDQRFITMADALFGDYMCNTGRNNLGDPLPILVKGGVNQYLRQAGTANPTPAAPTPWKPAAQVVLSSSIRFQWPGESNSYFLIDRGGLTNRWIRETPGLCYQIAADRPGQTLTRFGVDELRPDFYSTYPVPCHFVVGQKVNAYIFEGDGRPRTTRTATFTAATSTCMSDARARINGWNWLRISGGQFGGMWVSANQVHYDPV